MDEAEAVRQVSPEMELTAAKRARDRARAIRWDLDVAVFLFAVLIIIIILLFQGIGTGIVAPVAVFGLAMTWLVGWRRERQAYQRFHDEELLKLERELNLAVKRAVDEKVEKTIEEQVQEALRKRWR